MTYEFANMMFKTRKDAVEACLSAWLNGQMVEDVEADLRECMSSWIGVGDADVRALKINESEVRTFFEKKAAEPRELATCGVCFDGRDVTLYSDRAHITRSYLGSGCWLSAEQTVKLSPGQVEELGSEMKSCPRDDANRTIAALRWLQRRFSLKPRLQISEREHEDAE